MATRINVTVIGDKEVIKSLDKLTQRLEHDLRRGMYNYIVKHLIVRIQKRLEHAAAPQAHIAGKDGLITPTGGYGVPHNDPDYADWKATRTNLPQGGGIGTRELVATGNLLRNVQVTKLIDSAGIFLGEVGPKEVEQSHVFPFRDDPGNPGAAKLYPISNVDLHKAINATDYAFWSKEFADCEAEVVPYIRYLIEIIIKELMSEYKGK